ncbi:hypothetical protein IHE44_0006093 [Lamprotornis superbus]|uniref:glutathione transferase n=1 Tax=Lamprotornis superbus TaxID=245042 RepID=A0A835U321_9PASS|nr:hypothetical protein IHE44_0006093 [Lamprotornis superbus]
MGLELVEEQLVMAVERDSAAATNLNRQHRTEEFRKVNMLMKVMLPLITGQPFPPEKLEFLTEDLNIALKQFEEKFLQDKPFIAGSEVSLADLVALVELMQVSIIPSTAGYPVCAGYDLFEERPKLREWRRRVEEAVGKELFQEAHKDIMNVKNLTADQFAPELMEKPRQLPVGVEMGLELYLDLLSQPCRSIYIFARSNNIPFEFKHVELFKDSVLGKKPAAGSGAEQPRAGPSNSEGAGKVSLLKKVPALKDGDFTLAECTAILLYLSRKYNTPDHWYPSDIQKRARVDEYLSWHHANIRANAPKTMWIKVLIPLFTGQPLPSEKLQEVMEGLSTSLKQFEERFLQDKAFIIGSEISLADLVAIVELMQPVGVGCDIFEDRPRLREWRRRVEDAVGKELFFQAHEMILNIKELSNIQIDPQLKEQLAPCYHVLAMLVVLRHYCTSILNPPCTEVSVVVTSSVFPLAPLMHIPAMPVVTRSQLE